MNWTKLIYVLIIVLLYVPMVFVGANVFFPKYTGSEAWFNGHADCTQKFAIPEKVDDTERGKISQQQQECWEEYNAQQLVWEKEKLTYEGKKYVFITLFNLLVLLSVLFLPKLQDSVTMGLFLGSVAATFGATIRYFDTRSKIGFALLVLTFVAALFFINHKKEGFISWKEEKKGVER
ncbi:hypothetical protein J4210_00930 [Candidatus Woesearchaeota archaeon]|nr:hypothetical protein [Candidatus Woesearchaeota archaeon]